MKVTRWAAGRMSGPASARELKGWAKKIRFSISIQDPVRERSKTTRLSRYGKDYQDVTAFLFISVEPLFDNCEDRA